MNKYVLSNIAAMVHTGDADALDQYVKLADVEAELMEVYKPMVDKAFTLDIECRYCGGEIPYGHSVNCICWKAEKFIKENS